ncbi:MAG: hypothetical protein ACI9F9_001338 [Candidatus Paceibacteria bacterium]|jgi:hypothetical protein
MSVFLHQERAQLSKASPSRFLQERVLWLLLLEVTVVAGGWIFDLALVFSFFQVIGAIGAAMIVLAGLIWLPTRAVLASALILSLRPQPVGSGIPNGSHPARMVLGSLSRRSERTPHSCGWTRPLSPVSRAALDRRDGPRLLPGACISGPP